MSGRVASIEDIARVAGVSPSTVSRALRDDARISVETRARVRRLAGELGYVPNGVARGLRERRTNTVGLVVTSIADPFWADVLHGAEGAARPSGIGVLLSSAYEDPAQELVAIERFYQHRVDGILIADSRLGARDAARLTSVPVPTVLVNSQVDEPREGLRSVSIDDYAGAQLATEHLLSLGHRRIGFLGVGNRPRSHRRRSEAWRAALRAAGIAPDPAWLVVPDADTSLEDDAAAGEALLPRLLDAGVTAISCYNDMVAIGALVGCRARGIAVPDELSIVGFDDVPIARYVAPPLTTIHQPRAELGGRAMALLLDLLVGEAGADAVITPTLVVRGSTGPVGSRQSAEGDCAEAAASVQPPRR